MINIENHEIVDILNSREVDKVAEWLKEFKNIDTVSRDGAVTYNAAINKAFPKATQISDRFHLLKSLTEHLKIELKRLVKKSINIYSDEIMEKDGNKKEFTYKTKGDLIREVKKLYNENYSTVEICNALGLSKYMARKYRKMNEKEIDAYDKPTNTDKRKERQIQKIWEKAQQVQKEYETCKDYSKIGGKLDMDYRTVKKYLQITDPQKLEEIKTANTSKLDQYKEIIIEMNNQGETSATIYKKIKEEGYEGKPTILKAYLAEIRRQQKSKYKILSNITQNTLISLLYNGVEKVKNITKEIFEEVKKQYSDIAKIYYVIESFRIALFSKAEENIDLWIKEIKELNIEEVNKFIAGIERDINAVKSAVKLDYNNGLAEGSVNKIKVIKRIMYGRCSHDLLRQKLLI